MGQFETNMNEFRGEYDQIKIKKKDLEEKAVELMEVLDKKKELLSEKDSEFQKLCKIVEKSKSSLSKLTKQIFEEKEKTKNVEAECKGTAKRIKITKKEWSALRDKYK